MIEVAVVILAICALFKAQIVMDRVDTFLREDTTKNNPPKPKLKQTKG
jgi:hypothetical protein